MKFEIKGSFKENIYNLMRKIGYHLRERQRSVEMNEVHRLQGEEKEKEEFIFTRPPRGYPRFHIYLKIDGSTDSPQEIKNLIFNLHLDQKKPIYKGATAHSGEYEGELIEKEAERIKQILQNAKN